MTDVWLVIAVDYEDFAVRGVLSSEDAAVAFARDQAEREAQRTFGDHIIIIEKHRLDPEIGAKREVTDVEYSVPRLGPPQFLGVSRMGSIGIPPP